MNKDSARKKEVLRNMLVLLAGAGGAKIVGLAAIPLLTRLYEPSQFGVLSLFTAVVTIILPTINLRYAVAIPIPKKDVIARNILVLSVLLVPTTCIFYFAVIFLLKDYLFEKLALEPILQIWWLICPVLAISSLHEIFTFWATRRKDFKIIAKVQVGQVIVGSGIKLGLGIVGGIKHGLIAGQVFQQGCGLYSLIKSYLAHCVHAKAYRLSTKRLLCALKVHRDFPRYRLPAELIFAFSSQAPLIFFSMLYGTSVTGQLGLALMSITLPVSLLGQTIGKAYYAEISLIGRNKSPEIYRLTVNIILTLLKFSIPPALVLMIFGERIFSLAFGSAWSDAGVYAQILSIYLVFQLAANPIISCLSVLGQQSVGLSIQAVRAVLVILIFGVSKEIGLEPSQTLIFYSSVLAAHYAITTFRVLRVIKREAKK